MLPSSSGCITNPTLIRLASWLERSIYGFADAVTVLSEDLRDNVASKLRAATARRSTSSPTSSTPTRSGPRPRQRLPRRVRPERQDRGDVCRQRRLLPIARPRAPRGRDAGRTSATSSSSSTVVGRPGPTSSAGPRAVTTSGSSTCNRSAASPRCWPPRTSMSFRFGEAWLVPACRRRPTRSWPPGARSSPASTPARRWPTWWSGPGGCRGATRRSRGLHACDHASRQGTRRGGPHGSRRSRVCRAMGVTRRGRGPVRGAVRRAQSTRREKRYRTSVASAAEAVLPGDLLALVEVRDRRRRSAPRRCGSPDAAPWR